MDAADPILDPVYGMEPNGLRAMHASDANRFAFPNINIHSDTHGYGYIYTYGYLNTDAYAYTYSSCWTTRSGQCVGNIASRSTVRRNDR